MSKRQQQNFQRIARSVLLILLFGKILIGISEVLFSSRLLAQTIQPVLNTQNDYDAATEQFQQGNYQHALPLYQQALNTYRESHDLAREGEALHKMGASYYRLHQYDEALNFYQQALALRQTLDDQAGIGSTLNGIGAVYHERGDYDRALEYYQKTLEIRRELSDIIGEVRTLNNLGLLYENKGEYATALENYTQALDLLKALDIPREEGAVFNNLGGVYNQLGQYDEAWDFYQKALKIVQDLEDRLQEGKIRHNMALVSSEEGKNDQAVGFYQKALEIRRAIEDYPGIAATLNNLGLLYSQRHRSTDALNYLEEALTIFQKLGDRAGEGRVLDSLGSLYLGFNNQDKALEVYHQSLAIQLEIGDRPGQIITLNNLASALEKQGEIELAIVFYKRSVALTETTRQEIQALSKDLQDSYTSTIAQTYRHLADLLLQQNRVLEAQKVIELLKKQEIDHYLQDVQNPAENQRNIEQLPSEGEIWNRYSRFLEQSSSIGKEIGKLRLILSTDRTEFQQARLLELEESQKQILDQFNHFFYSDEMSQLLAELKRTTRERSISSLDPNELPDYLQNLQSDAILLYPLVLYDRLELIVVTPNAEVIHKSVSVPWEELNQTIVEFRAALQDPTSDTSQPARQLYQWLIEPLGSALDGVETIIYAPDSQLRYIPLAALYDGDRWLVERFRINNITAASLTNFQTQSSPELHILAGAFANGFYSFQVGNKVFNLRGLPHAEPEVKVISETIPNTTILVDQAFSSQATISQIDDYTIAHFATHATFTPGQPQDSFIMFGNGEKVTLQDFKNWSFRNLDLVVLSACETGLGGLGNGEEILGFGYLMQDVGAKASISSLWKVEDSSTQILMNSFYAALAQGHSKVESLRQAQLRLITGADIASDVQSTLSTDQLANNRKHPYYWSPFILIGNGF